MDINLTSLKLTARLPLKMDGWKTIRLPFWCNLGLFSGAKMLLLGERTCCHSQIHMPKTSSWRLLVVECLSNLEVPISIFSIYFFYIHTWRKTMNQNFCPWLNLSNLISTKLTQSSVKYVPKKPPENEFQVSLKRDHLLKGFKRKFVHLPTSNFQALC